jgi:hypothetical protein
MDLRSKGYLVEVQSDISAGGSVRLRVESPEYLGEVVIWDSLRCDNYVASLETGNVVYEMYGMVLSIEEVSHQLGSFLSYFPR